MVEVVNVVDMVEFGYEFWLGVWVGLRLGGEVPQDLLGKVEREILEMLEIELRDAVGLNKMVGVRRIIEGKNG